MLYKKRWETELFSQMDEATSEDKILLGHNLKCCENPNVLCDHGLVAKVGDKLKVDRKIYEILQILSISLLDKTSYKIDT